MQFALFVFLLWFGINRSYLNPYRYSAGTGAIIRLPDGSVTILNDMAMRMIYPRKSDTQLRQNDKVQQIRVYM